MSITILGRDGDPERAQLKLEVLIDDPLTVLALIRGEGAQVDRAIEIATGRASVKPGIRRVVWLPDPSVLSDEQRESYFPEDTLLATIGLDDQVAERLSPLKSTVKLYVERAFVKAEGQGA